MATQALVHDALKVAEEMEREGVSIEVIDPRSLKPLDANTILTSVEKTGRLIVADEGWLTCGFASEVSAIVAERGITFLDAPIVRVGAPDVPCPLSPPLEDAYIPGEKGAAGSDPEGALGIEERQMDLMLEGKTAVVTGSTGICSPRRCPGP